MNDALFYKDKPVFGLDIGFSSLKVMEVDRRKDKKHIVTGYGITQFDPKAVKDGVIVDVEGIAKATHELFKSKLIGDITTRRVALSIPASRTFNRSVRFPKLDHKDIDEAVRLEAEQYIPMALDDLYIDHDIVRETNDSTELLISAAPRKIVDSYISLARVLGLEVVAIDTTIGACSRLFTETTVSDIPTILIDFGSISSDITIYDGALVVTGTVPGGGDSFTKLISDKLKISPEEADVVKTKYGLSVSKKQKEITEALNPLLDSLLKEIHRMMRYYEERAKDDHKIKQVVTMGGGANMPGLSEYMINRLRIPVRVSHPWERLEFAKLQPPNPIEKSMYITVAGLALIRPKEVFND